MTSRRSDDTRTRARCLAGALATAVAALPGTAQAGVTSFGSDLRAPADWTEEHQADTLFYNGRLPGGARTTVPADGQIIGIKVKGIAPRREDARPVKSPPVAEYAGSPMIHVQVLVPQRDGSHRVKVTSSPFYLPTSGDPQQITSFTSAYRLCAERGDVIALNTIGGWDGVVDQTGPYPLGTPLRIFSHGVRGAVLRSYTANGGTMDGAVLRANRTAGRELLMQLRLGTGRNANQVCPGGKAGAAPPRPTAASVTYPRVGFDRRYRGRVAVHCHGGNDGRRRCRGRLWLTAAHPRTSAVVTLSARRYSLRADRSAALGVRMTRAARRAFAGPRRFVPATATLVSPPGGAPYTRTAALSVRVPRSR